MWDDDDAPFVGPESMFSKTLDDKSNAFTPTRAVRRVDLR